MTLAGSTSVRADELSLGQDLAFHGCPQLVCRGPLVETERLGEPLAMFRRAACFCLAVAMTSPSFRNARTRASRL